MSTVSRGFALLSSLAEEGEDAIGQGLLQDLLGPDGKVRFTTTDSFHDYLRTTYGFRLRRNTEDGVVAGGRHLFYVRGNLLLRVKTSGTRIRPRPHMTISAATGLNWPDEGAKFNQQGDVVPKLGASAAGSNWRALQRIGDYDAIAASDQEWADSCHFDFPDGFSDAGAASLPVEGP